MRRARGRESVAIDDDRFVEGEGDGGEFNCMEVAIGDGRGGAWVRRRLVSRGGGGFREHVGRTIARAKKKGGTGKVQKRSGTRTRRIELYFGTGFGEERGISNPTSGI